jgi:deoxyribodipyrimidine photolyase-related protein
MAGAAAIRLVLGDQLTRSLSSLRDLDPARDVVLMAEVMAEATYVRHHPKKIAFLFSAMRHFAEALRAEGVTVDYVTLEEPENTGSLGGEAARAVARHGAGRLIVTECGEYRLAEDMKGWEEACGVPVDIRTDDRFLCSRAEFADWAEGRKSLRMEYFYRDMRTRYGVLLDADGEPEGGKWNYDPENRKALPADAEPPAPLRFEPDETTERVLGMVRQRFAGDHFGDLDGFRFAVTPEQAEDALEHFITHALPRFGDYQDAMAQDQPTLYHSVLSIYMNAGLLDPLKTVQRAERAYRDGHAPLNAVEGYIRQILGWREYIRGIYWLKMPDYAETNFFNAVRPLPQFYWTGETEMNCLAQAIGQTKREAYAHHIQRLMVTGTFALLAGIDPKQVNEWYLIVYADAYEWVELPNVQGMALFADGGVLASKPYAASGNYINKMSDYCRHCSYDVKRKTGEKACPFNYLYWQFLMDHEATLRRNPRIAAIYGTLDRMGDQRKDAIRRDSARFLEEIGIDTPQPARRSA